MEEKILKPSDAWKDFFEWIRAVDLWSHITEDERQYLRKTNRAAKAGMARAGRLNNLFTKYAPGRYKLNQATFTKTETP